MDLDSFLPPDGAHFWSSPQQLPHQNGELDAVIQTQHAPDESFASSSSALAPQQDDTGLPDQPVPRDIKARPRNGVLNWEHHKGVIKQLWLEDDFKLEDLRTEMKNKYLFDATPKQYKDRFRLWGWQKNLPVEVAQFIVKKTNDRKRATPSKNTAFQFGGKNWTLDRAQMTAKRAKREQTTEMEVETPEGVSYKTPAKTPAALAPSPQNALVLSPADEDEADEVMTISSTNTDNDEDWVSDDEAEDGLLLMSWNGLTVSDLPGLLESAQQHDRDGDNDRAEDLFLQTVEGHRQLLGPTNDDTINVSYKLATFYFEHDRPKDTYRVIEESTRAFVVQLGLHHQRTQQHIMYVVELLNNWHRENEALAFLSRVRELTERGIDGQKRAKPRSARATTTRMSTGHLAGSAISRLRSAEPSPANLDYEISVARTYAQSDNEASETILRAILNQCPAEDMNLVIQRLDALVELLKLFTQSDRVAQNTSWFDHAIDSFNYVMNNYPWGVPTREKFKSLRLMEAFLKLGAALNKAQWRREASVLFEKSLEKAEEVFQPDDERTIWMGISVGIIYQTQTDWTHAEPWFERALSAALSHYDDDDGIVMSLQEAFEVRHFSYLNDEGRPYRTIFGVNGLTIRPTRLHIE